VAGGAGFIGSHLCERLLAEGATVLCVDNLITGSRANVQQLHDNPHFTFIEHDVIEPLDVDADAVFHLASPASPNPASPRSYIAHAIETALANSAGSHRLLELARHNSARYLFASTSEVYGDPLVHPQPETYFGHVNPNGFRSCYDESKRFGEALAMSYRRTYGMDIRIVRIFNTYGPRCDPEDGRLIPNFVTQALSGEPITVYGDGSQSRSLCYVSDLVEGMLRMMTSDTASGEVVNLGNPREHTVLEYAELIRKLCRAESEIVYQPLRTPDDPSRRQPDITKAGVLLGWKPRVVLEDGLMRTIEWYRAALAAQRAPAKR